MPIQAGIMSIDMIMFINIIAKKAENNNGGTK